MNVDEARCDNQAVGIDLAICPLGQSADFDDSAVSHPDVCGERWAPRTVHYRSTLHDQVKHATTAFLHRSAVQSGYQSKVKTPRMFLPSRMSWYPSLISSSV
jgi:hypothetical protein